MPQRMSEQASEMMDHVLLEEAEFASTQNLTEQIQWLLFVEAAR